MQINETQKQRSASYAPKESNRLDIFTREVNQWKRTSKIKTSPSATFGKSQRNSEGKKQIPGPGAYQLNKTTFQKGFVSFKGNKKMRFYTDNPGPGAYQPKPLFPTKRFSFEKNQYHQKVQLKPSPVTYNLREEKAHGLSFTKQDRNLSGEKQKISIPGPGKYESSKIFAHKNQFSFTRTKKFFENQNESQQKDIIPGPAAYELSKTRNSIKTAKFAKAMRTFLQDDKLPGPGSYNLDKSTLQARGGIISAQKRQHNYDNQVPGPGNYKDISINSIKKKQAIATMNRSRQTSADKKQQIPGPGSYFRQLKVSEKIMGGVIGKDVRSNQKQIISANLANTTHILFNKQIKQDYSSNAFDRQQRLTQTEHHNAFERIRIQDKRNELPQL